MIWAIRGKRLKEAMKWDEALKRDLMKSKEKPYRVLPKRNLAKKGELNQCPFCRERGGPKLQEVTQSLGKGYVVRCETCWSITINAETREEAVKLWNDGAYTKRTYQINAFNELRKTDPDIIDMDGANELARTVVESAANEYMEVLRLMRYKKTANFKDLQGHKRKLEKFFLDGALMKGLPVDGEDVIKVLKKKTGYERVKDEEDIY